MFAVIKRLFFVLSCCKAALMMAEVPKSSRWQKKKVGSARAEKMREAKRLKPLEADTPPSSDERIQEEQPGILQADPGQDIHSKNGCVTLTHERMSFDCPKFDTLHTCVITNTCRFYTCVESYVC